MFIPVASVLLLCAVLYSVKDYTLGVKVYIEGQEVATLKNEEEYEAVATRVERYVSGITGGSYELSVQPTYQMALVNKKNFGRGVACQCRRCDLRQLRALCGRGAGGGACQPAGAGGAFGGLAFHLPARGRR